MDRRKFLKYAGATAAVVGASALGLNYLTEQSPSIIGQTSPTTLTPRLSTTNVPSTASSESFQLASLEGKLFFDYNGNGKQDTGEPPLAGALIRLDDNAGNVVAQSLTDSSGDYALEDFRAGSYKLHVEADKKFHYMCRSTDEFTTVSEGYDVLLDRSQRADIGLMEGYLTMITSSKTNFVIDRYYDHNPDPNAYLWWNGQRGFDKDLPRGYSPNHPGIDYSMSEGNILLAQAPGTCRSGEDQGGKYIFITHPNGFMTSHGHISKSLVEDGAFVSRGQPIAISGKSGANTEAANYPHDHVGLYFNNRNAIDQYSPKFNMSSQYAGYYDGANGYAWIQSTVSSSPNLDNYWTVFDNPQFFD